MFFIIIGLLFLLFVYYYYNSGTKREGLVNLKNFIPSDKFNGSKQGYVFKNCSKGLGYYKDKYN